MKPGTAYEIFVKNVYEILNKIDGMTDINIQHDVKIKGKSGTLHQIDVYWTFCRAGVTYRVAIECKDYKSKVSKEKVMAFRDKIEDIGNDIRGIFATSSGYQSGAIKYGESYGIQMMEIRRPTDDDWNGRIRNIAIELHILIPTNISAHFLISEEDCKKLSSVEKSCLNSTQIPVLFDEADNEDNEAVMYNRASVQELFSEVPSPKQAQNNITYRFLFKKGIIYINNKIIPVKSVVFKYDLTDEIEHVEIKGEDYIKAVVKNIIEGTMFAIDKNDLIRRDNK